jgi:hypothetical protein
LALGVQVFPDVSGFFEEPLATVFFVEELSFEVLGLLVLFLLGFKFSKDKGFAGQQVGQRRLAVLEDLSEVAVIVVIQVTQRVLRLTQF